jgi:hypothetical protein
MKNLATAIVAGNMQAVLALLGFAILALLLPVIPLGIIASGATAVLLGLYYTQQNAFTPIGIACAVFAGMSVFLFKSVWFGLVFALFVWLLPSLLSRVLRHTQSLSFALQILGLAGIILLLGVRILIPDIDLHWHELIKRYVHLISEHAQMDEKSFAALTDQIPYGFTAQLIASMMLLEGIILFVGRWWHACIDEKVSFQSDFLALKLGKFLGSVALLLALGALLLTFLQIEFNLIKELTLVALSLFLLQGLAIIHKLAGRMLKSRLWLITAYAALVLIPFFSFAVTLTGVIDNFINFRKYIENK